MEVKVGPRKGVKNAFLLVVVAVAHLLVYSECDARAALKIHQVGLFIGTVKFNSPVIPDEARGRPFSTGKDNSGAQVGVAVIRDYVVVHPPGLGVLGGLSKCSIRIQFPERKAALPYVLSDKFGVVDKSHVAREVAEGLSNEIGIHVEQLLIAQTEGPGEQDSAGQEQTVGLARWQADGMHRIEIAVSELDSGKVRQEDMVSRPKDVPSRVVLELKAAHSRQDRR